MGDTNQCWSKYSIEHQRPPNDLRPRIHAQWEPFAAQTAPTRRLDGGVKWPSRSFSLSKHPETYDRLTSGMSANMRVVLMTSSISSRSSLLPEPTNTGGSTLRRQLHTVFREARVEPTLGLGCT